MEIFKITAHTDGGTHLTNPGPGAAAIVIQHEKDGTRHIKKVGIALPLYCEIGNDDLYLAHRGKTKKPVQIDGKYFMETTNNRCELTAIIEAMKMMKKPDQTDLTIYSDSQWAINITNGTWKPKDNLDLVEKARKLYQTFYKIQLEWVRGHIGNRFNEMCDELASKISEEQPTEPYIETLRETISS